MLQPEIKLYSEIKEIFDDIPQAVLEQLSDIDSEDEDFTFDWVYVHRWELFDMSVDDELIFDYRLVEDIQDMAARYLESKQQEV